MHFYFFFFEHAVLVHAIWGDLPVGTIVLVDPEGKIRKSPSFRLLKTISIEEL